MATTIGHVAARAGVSKATVSRVVNGTASVRPTTEERVRRAVESLGYRPDRRARDLSLGNASAVAVVARSGSGLVAPMTRLLSERGFDVALHEAADQIAGFGDIAHRVGGVVAYGVSDDVIQDSTAGSGVPVVSMDPGDLAVDRVVIDRDPAICSIAHHLGANGHQTTALFDEGSISNSRVADLRTLFGGYGVRLLRPSRQLDGLASVLGRRDGPTAILAANAVIALRTLSEARALGYLIPHELSIVVLRADPATEAIGMSSITEPILEAAQLAIDLISSLIASPQPGRPGIEIRLRASYVPGVTTRRMGDRSWRRVPERSR